MTTSRSFTESVRRDGLRGEGAIDHAVSVVLARADDAAVDRVAATIAGHLPRVQVARWGHAQVFAVARKRPELADWADRLARRYLLPEECQPG